MMKLDDMKMGTRARIGHIEGDVRLLTRLASIGLVPGSTVEVVRNDSRRPMLVFGRDTLLAVSRRDCRKIEAEEVA